MTGKLDLDPRVVAEATAELVRVGTRSREIEFTAQVLCRAVVALQSGETQRRAGRDPDFLDRSTDVGAMIHGGIAGRKAVTTSGWDRKRLPIKILFSSWWWCRMK